MLKRLPSIGTLFRDSLALFQTTWQQILGLLLIPGLIILLAAIPLLSAVLRSSDDVIGAVLGAGIAGGIFLLLGTILGWIAMIFSHIAIVIVFLRSTERLAMRSALRASTPYFWPYVWVSILYIVPVVLLDIVSNAIGLDRSPLFAVLKFIATLAYGTYLGFSLFTLIDEGKRGIDALKASATYVHPHFFGVLGRSIILGVVLMVLILAVTALLFALLTVAKFAPAAIFAAVVLGIAAYLAIIIFTDTYNFTLYKHTKTTEKNVSV